MIFIRLLVLAAVLTAAAFALRRWWRSTLATREDPSPTEIPRGDLRRMEELARSSPKLGEALTLRARILEDARGRQDELRPQVDEVLRLLSSQVEIERRIASALGEVERRRLAAELEEADLQLRSAEDAEQRRLAEGTMERLVALRDSLDKLKRRHEELETTAHHIVLELRNIHIKVLEASSSAAGLVAEDADGIRHKLLSASEELQRQTSAEAEVTKLLRGADEARRTRETS